MSAFDELTVRPFRGRDDYQGMVDLINARVAEEGEGERATVASLAEVYDHLVRCDTATDMLMVDNPDGSLAAYGRVAWHDVSEGYRAYSIGFEAQASPAALEADVIRWGVDRATAIASGHDHPDKRIGAWANDGTRRQVAVLAVGGFSPVSWSAYMVRPHLDDIPDRPLPDGSETRPVEDDHLRAIWEADNEAFRDHQGFVEPTDEDWERFRDEAAQGTDLWRVAWAGDSVVGQVRTRVREGEAEALGRRRAWTEDISTRRDWRGRGVASALIASSLHQLAGLGFDEAALGVDLDNPTGALGVYERMGYQVVHRQTQYSRPV